jgi:hypothetical protein
LVYHARPPGANPPSLLSLLAELSQRAAKGE